ncbi:MAG: serpin family protein [Chloroflexi bacterium]|nr:serpin family protein [Chloroflexota bacterium]
MRAEFKIGLVLLLVFILASVLSAGTAAGKGESSMSELVEANNDFGFKLLGNIYKEGPGANSFISPSSIAMALAMTYNGAAGKTKDAMAKTLELKGIDLKAVNESNAALMKSLAAADPGVRLNIANSLWGRKGINFKQAFIGNAKKYYDAKVTALNFSDLKSPGVINSWVSAKTQGKIGSIVDKIEPNTILFLINAVYFKGSWATKFDSKATRDLDFTLLTGKKKKVPMMSQSGKYRYLENDGFQAVSLPYGKGRMSMYIFLPKKDGIDGFVKKLNSAEWENWMAGFSMTEGDITTPKFKMEYGLELSKALSAMGMGIAFDMGKADFTGMSAPPTDPYISKVMHKTFVEVNEEGTEAAAVTSVVMTLKSAVLEPPKRFKMVVDRPFFCAIRDNRTGTILFMGNIVKP